MIIMCQCKPVMATFCCFAEDKASVAFCLLPYLLEKKTKKTPTPQDYLYQVTAKYLYYLVSIINIRVSMYTLTVCSSVMVLLKRMRNCNFLKCSNSSFSKFKKDFAPDFLWL